MTDSRIDYFRASPDAVKAMMGLEGFVNHSGLEKSLLNLVKLRASQINGCAYCVDLHCAEARKAGETERRLFSVVVWREAPFFTDRERAALAMTEAVTLVAETHVPDDIYEDVSNFFTDAEMVNLTMAIVTINAWNRMSVTFRKLPV